MLISDWIENESWNGGKWLETFMNKYTTSFSLQVTPNTLNDSKKWIVVVFDDPYADKEEPFATIIPDQEAKDHFSLIKIVEKTYKECLPQEAAKYE